MVRNMEKKYKAYRIVDGKPRWIIVDENGNIVNRNPSKCELKGLEKQCKYDKNEDYTKLEYVWRIPGEIAEKGQFIVGLNSWSRTKFTVDNKEYDIIDKLIEVLMKNGLNRKVGIIE